MLDRARFLRPNHVEGRWTVTTRLWSRDWELVLEPDFEARLLVLVTAYAIDGQS